jgi:predicted GH43/DUF377 family glycosyl hydrolase
VEGANNMAVMRSEHNPIIEPKDVKPSRPDFEVVCAFNAGVTRHDGDVLLLLRVAEVAVGDDAGIARVPVYDPDKGELIVKEFRKDDPSIDFSDSRFVAPPGERYLTSISHLRVARGKDGIHFEIEETPAMAPASEYEKFGIEDPRITLIDDMYWINFSCISDLGVTTSLASTKDFRSYERHGVIFLPDNKDVEIFPGKINGKYYALSRPASPEYKRPEIWIAESPDLICWGNHRRVMGLRPDRWDCERIGGSAVPFLIDEGWVEIYHGADHDNRYCLGAALLDKNEPWKVISRCEGPIMEPETDYEIHGFFGNVIFNNGVLHEDGLVKIYYGAADTCIGYAEIAVEDILASLRPV